MPITIKSTELKYKNPSTGEYQGIDAVAERTTSEQCALIEAKGAETIASIPSDYITLANNVSDLNGAINALCLKGAQTTINQAGTYSNISCTGLTANHKVCNWGLFSDSGYTTPVDENNPPADITITEKANAYDIVIANYSSAFYIQPTFILAQN
jgi:hypothetical protein